MYGETFGIFYGIGILILYAAVAWGAYHLFMVFKDKTKVNRRWYALECLILDNYAENKGYDLGQKVQSLKFEEEPEFKDKIKKDILKDWNEE